MTKIFAHRGYTGQGAKENSLESLHAAYENKYPGVEFDIWFVEGQLLVNHDMPQHNNLPKFSDYLQYKNELEYWLDFKNLDASNAGKAFELVKNDIKAAGIDPRKIYFAPFIEILAEALPVYEEINKHFASAQIMAVCEKIDKKDLISYHNKLQKNHIKFLSIAHENIDENFVDIFRDINCFAWTVNDFKRLQALQKLGIKNFASDIIKL